jgi:hypothetical protein
LITYIDSTASGCKNQSTIDIAVHATTPVAINPLRGAYNIEHLPVLLSALPGGGTFSGNGILYNSDPSVLSYEFYPNLAGIANSPHTITYTYSNSFGCLSQDVDTIRVVKATGKIQLDSLHCYNSSPFTAVATTDYPLILGKFELQKKTPFEIIPDGPGVHDNGDNSVTVTPENLNDGEYILVYKYYASDTLILEEDFVIETIAAPKITGYPVSICENAGSERLFGDATNGRFIGTGVTGNSTVGFKFDPAISGHGVFNLTYIDSTVNGCKSQVSQEITVFYVPEMGFVASDSCVTSDSNGTAITFINKTANPELIKYWGWNFDDINSGAANISTLESPEHTYKNSGKYTIALSDSTVDGCFAKHEIQFTFGDRPTGEFKVLNKCFTPGVPTEFESNTITNDGIKLYSWTFQLPDGITSDTTTTSKYLNYLFETPGKYVISHKATSNTNCDLLIADYSITLQPTVVLTAGIPYKDDFSNNDRGWSISRDLTYPGESWTWGTPADFDSLKNDNRNAWYTKRLDSSVAELSYLISPCFNLSALTRPMVKMDIFRNFVSPQDAVILRYTINNGVDWPILGYPGDGINWYSDYQTTNYAFGLNYGWANIAGSQADGGWVESRHILDKVAKSTGADNVQFRLEFGATKSTISGYEGFAINSFSISERNRFSVLEHFTNITAPLSPVKAKIEKANATVNALYRNEFLFEDFVKLEYHTKFPSTTDSLNIFNPDVPGARSFYYGVTTVPYSLLDGGDRTDRRYDFSDTKYEPKVVDINIRSLEDPPVAILVDATASANDLDVKVSIKALENLPKAERTLYVILYEPRVDTFLNVVRNMLPDARGTATYQAFSATPADTSRLEYSFTADMSQLNKEWIRVAAYLQDGFTGEIIQAALSDYSKWGVGFKPETVYANSLNVFPNPAKDYVEVNISGNVMKASRIEIFDQLGRNIYSGEMLPQENSLVVNTSDFEGGIYYLRMTTSGIQKSETKKLVIVK